MASLNSISNIDLTTVGQVLGLDSTASTIETTASAVTADDSSSAISTAVSAGTTTASTTYSSNLSSADVAAKGVIAQRELSGNYTAQNSQYCGRYQLTISYLNGDLSAENQERVAGVYVASRYGSWSATLTPRSVNGWY